MGAGSVSANADAAVAGGLAQDEARAPVASTSAAATSAAVAGPSTSAAAQKEDTPGTEPRSRIYKPKRNCIERYLQIRT